MRLLFKFFKRLNLYVLFIINLALKRLQQFDIFKVTKLKVILTHRIAEESNQRRNP